MSIIAKHIPFVNGQIAFHEKQIARYSSPKHSSEFRMKLHTETRDKFVELSVDLLKADKELDDSYLSLVESPSTQQLLLTFEEVSNLPEELIKELSAASVIDKGDAIVLQLMDDYGGVISLDRLLIDIYKKTAEINKRSTLTSRLYRMSQKGLVHGVPGKKGFYSKKELCAEDALKLFGKEEE